MSLRNIEDRRRCRAELERQAHQDQLTGLAEPLCPGRAATVALDEVDTGVGMSAVIFLDLDRLKVINDSLGHEIGDAILKVVGDRLRSSIRPTDMVARFGGDEFVMVCSGLSRAADALDVAQRISDSLAAPIVMADRTFHVSAAVGVAMVTSAYTDTDDLIRDADAAMYQAKSAGRASIRAFDPGTHDKALRRLDFESTVRSGHGPEQWELHYQPQCSIETGEVIGFEALARWRHPERGLLMPDEFISSLEDAGLIAELDHFVLRRAAAFAASPAISPLHISVNVSAGQLLAADFPDFVTSVLADAGLPSERLTIEITESGMIQDLAVARRTLRTLRDLGVGVSVDDFGTGFSALSYLAELPVTELKIDRSFVTRSDTPTGRSLLEGIVSLATSMAVSCVAEGVESQDQLDLLAKAGCSTFQGYLVAPAMQEHEVETFLKQAEGRHQPRIPR
ncbi:MAG: bifunctional diguanylate cyclase/phosphodiesterase [Acidimicrobiales bacterium]